ncbi:MAG: hypothetical protein GDA49_00505 [Rhodospirillales bacterium]|nr:hypothetical protein [Rhodospirillales bacterium]
MTITTALDQLLHDLRRNADHPFEQSRTAPPGIDTSEEFLAREQSDGWICVTPDPDIERPSLPNIESWYARLQEREAYRSTVMTDYSSLKDTLIPGQGY